MAIRKRTIQPDMWKDLDFGRLSLLAKLIFIGCITQADDDGRLIGVPEVIKSSIFPYDNIKIMEIIRGIKEIEQRMRNFLVYEIDNCQYIQLYKWNKHQVQQQNRRLPSMYPPPPNSLVSSKCLATAEQVLRQVSKQVRGSSSKASPEAKEPEGLTKVRDLLKSKGIIKKQKYAK